MKRKTRFGAKTSVKSYIALAAALLLIVQTNAYAAASDTGTKLSSSYIYFGSASAYADAVNNTQGSLDRVYPSYFDLNTDGSLKLTAALSKDFIDTMHTEGIRVVPFLSNHWKRAVGIAALRRRVSLAQQIGAAVAQYNLDGVNIDLENLTPSERADYVDFIRLLRAELPADKEISVAVAANPYGTTSDWQGSYDYAGLAQYSDYLVIMAYDEHCQNGPAGPVASIPFIEKSLRYAVAHADADKIVLALSFYGRIWRDGGGSGDPAGYGISNIKIEQLIADCRGVRYYDSTSRTSYAKITVKAGDRKPVVGGKELPAGTYTIWYSDENTTKNALALVGKYDIKGVSSWSLGQESDSTWNYFKLWVNGCTFGDVQTHWARASILRAYLNGWIRGIADNRYSPDEPLSRAQAATILVRALGLEANSASQNENSPYAFDDTNGNWAQKEIETARKYGILAGVGGNRFEPDSPVTREQMAVILYRLMDLSGNGTAEVSAPVFTDLSPETNGWSIDAIAAVAQKGIYLGYEDGSFRPRDVLTRGQIAALLDRLYDSGAGGLRLV